MRYELRLNAFDCMDQIHVTYSLRSTGWGGDSDASTISAVLDLQGTGETRGHLWLRDVLVSVLETL